VDHAVRNAGQALEAACVVQVAKQRGDAAGPQEAHALRGRCQGHQANTLALWGPQLTCRAQAHIAATHDQNALSAKTGGQCTQGGLV
jgi:hypothetical protein